MNSDIQATLDAFTNGWTFLQNKGKETAIEFTKIYTLSMVLMIAELVILTGIILVGIGNALFDGFGKMNYFANILLAFMQNIALIAMIAIPVIFGFRILNAALGAVTHLVVSGKKTDIIRDTMALIVPVGGYAIAAFLLQVAIFIPPTAIIILVVLAKLDVLIIMIVSIVLLILTFAVWIVIRFFIQFGMLELVINQKGVISSINTSINLVKQNWKIILIFDIAMMIVLMMFSAVMGMVIQLVQVIFYISLIVPPLLILVVILFFIITIIQSVLTGLIVIPTQYLFWKTMNSGVKK